VRADVLDQRIVKALRSFGGEPGELLDALLHEFLVEAPSLVTEISVAVDQNAYASAARAAHQLRGISGHVGAARLADIAGAVEAATRTASRDAAASVATLRAELALVVTAARALLPQD
jgi:HPt (histidine-containing phosphotransfer) domain-containing protein